MYTLRIASSGEQYLESEAEYEKAMVVAKLPNNGSQSCARKARICAYDARTARSQQTIIIKRIQSCDIDASRRTDSQADRQALSPRESDLGNQLSTRFNGFADPAYVPQTFLQKFDLHRRCWLVIRSANVILKREGWLFSIFLGTKASIPTTYSHSLEETSCTEIYGR